jgi:cytochrome P450
MDMLQRPSSIDQLKEYLDRFKLMRATQPVSYASKADIAVSLRWLVGTGYEMVTHLLGNAVLCLLLHPEVIERLHQDPAPIYSTIEEALRYLPPVWRAAHSCPGAHLGLDRFCQPE